MFVRALGVLLFVAAMVGAVRADDPCRWYSIRESADSASGTTVPLDLTATTSGGITTLTASSKAPLSSVDFLENDVRVATLRQPPFELTLTPPPAQVAYTAVAYLASGSRAYSNCIPVGDSVSTSPAPIANGIVVGRAKQFDERALQEMLQSVLASIDTTNVVDMAVVRSAMGKMQGGQSVSNTLAVSATASPLPSIQRTESTGTTTNSPTSQTVVNTAGDGTTTTNVTSAAGTTTGTSSVNTVTSTPSVTYAAPAAPTLGTGFEYNPTFGFGASDVLSEQTELAYQAINLRMLLQRALSDRLLIRSHATSTQIDARSQPVLGFQVSVDPLSRYRGAIAEVVVTVRDRVLPRETPPSLVALLPRDKTYNVATLRHGAAALSLGAAVQAINVGVNAQHSRDTLYLVKDADTVALERIPESEDGSEAVSFGWQFRPVLDQKSVTAGTRQVYALLALPVGRWEPWVGTVEVTTRWRRYDRRTKTVGDVIAGSENRQRPYLFDVPAATDHDFALRPTVHSVSWEEAANGRAVVTIEGEFPRPTRIMAGDRLIDVPGDGLVVRTDRRIVVSVPAALIASSELTLVDTYGLTERVVHRSSAGSNSPGRLKIIDATSEIAGPDSTRVRVRVGAPAEQNANDGGVYGDAPPKHKLLALIGEQVFGFSGSPLRPITEGSDTYEFIAPTQLVQHAGVVRIVDPLWGDAYSDEHAIQEQGGSTAAAQAIVPLAISGTRAVLALTGFGLSRNAVVYIGNEKFTGQQFRVITPTLLSFDVDLASATNVKQAVVELGTGTALLLPVPELRVRPRFIRNEAVTEADARTIRIEGAALNFVKGVSYNNEALPFDADRGDPTIGYLTVSEKVTNPAGTKELTIVALDGSRTSYTLDVSPQAASAEKKSKSPESK